MAKFKKSAGKKTASAAKAPQADHLSKSISESAQQIWLAGVGAFSRAQAEGTKLFDGLVKEGLGLEQTMRKFAGGRAEVVRDVVESRVGQARERATDTWDKLEKVFEDRVQRALVKLGVPSREDLNDLSSRVETLTEVLRRQGGNVPARKATKKAAAPRKAAASRKATTSRKAAPAKRGRKPKAAASE